MNTTSYVIRLTQFVTVLSRWLARISGAVIALCALLIATEVILRNIFVTVRLNSFELSIYGFAAALAFGFAHVLVERAHIRIDIFFNLLPTVLRVIIDILALLGMTVMAVVMAWHAWLVVATSAQLGAVSNSTLQMPLVIPQSLWASGLSWFALVALVLTLRSLVFIDPDSHADDHS